jgi:hypothetical protein
MGLVLVISALNRQARGTGADFFAYYRGARLWVQGQNPYSYFSDYNFKYAPSSLLLFAPFSFFSFEWARWLYTLSHLFLTALIPYFILRILSFDKKSRPLADPNRWITGLFVGFLGLLRFIDEEYLQSQFGLPILSGMLIGIFLILKNARGAKWESKAGVLILSLFAQVKIHSLIVFASFFKIRKPRAWMWIAIFAAIPLLLPYPSLWLRWRELIQTSTPDIYFGGNLQGFFPFTELLLGWSRASKATLIFIVPVAVVLLASLPRFEVREASEKSLSFLLTVFSWMLFGITTSLLPWRYTYSVVWFFVALSWIAAHGWERKILMAITVFLALTPSGIVGHGISDILEKNQSIFVCMLILQFVMIRQARRSFRD